jgi:hypothetical protein
MKIALSFARARKASFVFAPQSFVQKPFFGLRALDQARIAAFELKTTPLSGWRRATFLKTGRLPFSCSRRKNKPGATEWRARLMF